MRSSQLRWRAVRVLGIAFLVAGGASCARPRVSDSVRPRTSPSPSTSSSAGQTPSSATSTWKTYTDPQYGFTIKYPADLDWEESKNTNQPGSIKGLRFFDPATRGRYPRGQVEVNIYRIDAADSSSWVKQHSGTHSTSGPPDTSNSAIYFVDVSNLESATVAHHSGASFLWQAPEAGTIHALAYFSPKDTAMVFEWWATDDAYKTTVASIYDDMMSSYSE